MRAQGKGVSYVYIGTQKGDGFYFGMVQSQ